MDKLQKTVSSEGRFKNLRETLKKYVFLNSQYSCILLRKELAFSLAFIMKIILDNIFTE